jgi:predicted PurR-regulated permease PerM
MIRRGGDVQNPLARERERATTFLFYGLIVLLGYFFYRIISPFLAPLGWAAVLGVAVYPWHRRLVPRYGRGWAAALSTIVVTVLIVGPGLAILTAFARESRAALAVMDRQALEGQIVLFESAWDSVRPYIPGAQGLDLRTLINDVTSRTAGFLAARVGGLLADLVVLFFQLFVTLFALFFFLRDADWIMRELRRLLPFEELRRERMIRETQELVYASIAAALMIAALQGLAGGLIFALFGIAAPVFWGVIMGFLSLLPLLGAWVVWAPAAIWLIATGSVGKGLLLIGLGAGIVGTIDNVLRPMILSGRTQMNGLLMFISLLGGVSVFGLLGLVLGPLVVALVAGLLEAYAHPVDLVSARQGKPGPEDEITDLARQ